MIDVKFKCNNCGCEKGEIVKDVNIYDIEYCEYDVTVYVECDQCSNRESIFKIGINE